jgi:hypothetical protein
MTKYTPGPWVINTAGSAKAGQPFKVTEIYVYAPDTQDDVAICADVIDPVTQAPSEANARLIAAAPCLLEALLKCRFDSLNMSLKDMEFCRAAIAKATGEHHE